MGLEAAPDPRKLAALKIFWTFCQMNQPNVKDADECQSMKDVRAAIDLLDEQLLDLLSQRIKYIARAAEIKTSIDSIRDDERIESMVARRKSEAREYGYSEQFIETLFRGLIEYSVAYEMQLFRNKN